MSKPQSYSNENFDRITDLANKISDRKRQNGRLLPQWGYSPEDWAEAKSSLLAPCNTI